MESILSLPQYVNANNLLFLRQLIAPNHGRVIRVMPNTPALVQCGASVYSLGSRATEADGHLVQQLFSSIGICECLPETHLDAVTGLSGSGPAYVSRDNRE